MEQYLSDSGTREMTPVLQPVFDTELVLLDPAPWGEAELHQRAKQLRLELLSVHLEAVSAIARYAATTDSLGFKEAAEHAYSRAVTGYRRVKRLLTRGPCLPEHIESLERLRLILPLPEGWTHLPDRGTGKPAEPNRRNRTQECLEGLTPREMQVLKLIAQGNSSKQVAFLLGISFKTAVCHRYNIMEKLDLHDVSSLVRYAIRRKLVQA